MWKCHLDCYMDMLEDILKTPADSNIGHFFEIHLCYPDEIKDKTKKSFCPENRISL